MPRISLLLPPLHELSELAPPHFIHALEQSPEQWHPKANLERREEQRKVKVKENLKQKRKEEKSNLHSKSMFGTY